MIVASIAVPVYAQPSNFLELDTPDANIRDSGAPNPPYDWGNSGGSSGSGGVFNGGTSNGSTTPPNPPSQIIADASVIDTAFIVDPLASDQNTCGTADGDSSVYTGAGGEKNGDLIPTMTWGVASIPPNKNDLSNVYALAHERTDGKVEIFFAAERSDNNGDSHLDFEFLQDEIAKTGACSGGFTGDRKQGDIIVAVDFTNGGGQPTATIYSWTCVPAAAIGTTCNPPATGPTPAHHYEEITTVSAVVRVNDSGPVPCGGWICRDSDGDPIADVPEDDFMEGGIVLDELGFTGCISTFLPHTRSSQEFTATLKDFAGPTSFNSCRPPDVSTTSVPNANNVVPGTSVHDTATITDNGNPVTAGTVDFFLCQPAEVTAGGCEGDAGTKIGASKTPNASGVATSDSTTNTNAIGKYCWRAEYTPAAGSRLLAAEHTNATTECFTTVKQPSTTTTTSNPNSSNVVPGSGVSDSAHVSGGGPTPTGTVTFFLCQPAQVTAGGCVSGGSQVGSAVTLDAGGDATSAITTNTNAIGKYCWRAEYSGDDYYLASSHTNSTTECFTTVKQPSDTVTTAVIAGTSTPAGNSVVPGTAVADIAVVSGSGPTPTGTVTFYLCQPADVTAAGCPSGGDQVGSAKTLSGGTATSDSTTNTTAIGKYCWRAVYSGDGYYNGSSHTDATAECFTVVKQPSSVATTSVPTGGSVPPGTSVHDTATVSGSGPTPTGTVTFFLCQPNEVTAGQGCVSGGTQIGGAVALSGGSAQSASTSDTTAIGTYCWRAEYSGNGFYDPDSHTNFESECFSTAKQPSTTVTNSTPTGGNVVPGTEAFDTATVSGSGPTPTGTVTFFLCGPADVTAAGCPAGGAQVGGAVALDGGVAVSASTTNTTAIGTYCWRAEYSGDGYYASSSHTDADAECFTTVKQPSRTSTTSVPTGGDVVPGTSVHDTATVSGDGPTPTGTVTFFLCQPSEVTAGVGCDDGDGTQIGLPESLSGGHATSDSTDDTLAIGTYCWRAEYSGDGFYNPSSHTNDDSECFTTVKQPSSTTTTSSPTGGSVVPGSAASDTAVVAGIEGGPTPTGSVTFFLCQPDDVTAGGCESGGTQVGGPINLDNGTATSASTSDTLAIGTYCWRAEYSGDGFYLPSSHTNATTECFTTVKQPSTTATTSTPTGSVSINLGDSLEVFDDATVTGIEGGPTPTGTVAFFLCGPIPLAEGLGCPSGGVAAGVHELADGKAQSEKLPITTAGRYCWRAEYSGDGFYLASSHTNTTTECFSLTVVAPLKIPRTGSEPFSGLPIGFSLVGFGLILLGLSRRWEHRKGGASA